MRGLEVCGRGVGWKCVTETSTDARRHTNQRCIFLQIRPTYSSEVCGTCVGWRCEGVVL